jgi:choline dehydrogenase-like flavoprotein
MNAADKPDVQETLRRQARLLELARDPTTTPFDFIVVGAGAGGGTMAARLAQGGRSVLLLDAGVDPAVADARPGNPLATATDDMNAWREVYQVPGYHGAATEDPPMSWDFSVRHYADTAQQQRDSKYEPDRDPSNTGQPGHGGVLYPRCSSIGGCTAHHAMITVKPNDQDWDTIAAQTGDPGWRSEVMQGYFARVENCLYYTTYNGFLSKALGLVYEVSRRIGRLINPRYQLDWGGHGRAGWLKTSFIDPLQVRAIAKGDAVFRRLLFRVILYLQTRPGALRSLFRSLLRLQAVQYLDPNITTERQQPYAQLKFIPIGTDGIRRNGLREYVLRIAAQLPDRLVVQGGAFVERLIFADPVGDEAARAGAVPLAIGVAVREGSALYEASAAHQPDAPSTPRQYFARREIVLCGGSFNTPQLLMLSGIGPADELARHGIAGPRNSAGGVVAPVVHLPGVGGNLQDRYEVSVISEAKKPFSTLDNISFRPDDPNDTARLQWLSKQDGLYATNGGALAVLMTTDQAPRTAAGGTADPDLFIFGVPAAFRGYYWGWSRELLRRVKGAPQEQRNLWSWVILKGYTDNRTGTVRLRSARPTEQVDICFNSFDPRSSDALKDRAAVAAGIGLVRDLNVRTGIFGDEVQPGPQRGAGSAELDSWIENEAWGHHACGTCRMGSDLWQADTRNLTDRQAVLDSALRVHGVAGLRVADASVFARIPGYFILAPILMVGEKAADLVLADAQAYPDALRKAEDAAVLQRRLVALNDNDMGDADAEQERPARIVGLALSGGGIRSATFGLGVLQAMARKGRLRDVDLMSSVSGGSYIGSFVGRLFTRLAGSVADPSGRVEEILSSSTSPQIWWLRRYANYIGGEGRTDFLNNLGVIWRNLLSVYLVLGTLFLALFTGLRWLTLDSEPLRLGGWLLSPWWWLPPAVLALWVLPSGLGFWLAARPRSTASISAQALLGWLALLTAAVSALALPGGLPYGAAGIGLLLLAWLWQEAVHWNMPGRSADELRADQERTRAAARAAGDAQAETRTPPPHASEDSRAVMVRNRLSQALGSGLLFLLLTLVWVAIDSLAFNALAGDMMMPIGMTAVGIAALLPALRSLVQKAADPAKALIGKLSGALRSKVLAGLVAFTLIGFALFALDHLALYVFDPRRDGDDYRLGIWVFWVSLLASLAFGRALGFLNLSSLNAAYGARLGRTFLGASNDNRINARASSEPTDVRNAHPDDDIAFHDYHPEQRGGPLHLVGVCVNETVDAASGRETREDKGLSMCVGPCGASVGVRYHALWAEPVPLRLRKLRRFVYKLLGVEPPQPPPGSALSALSAGSDPHTFHVLKDGDKEAANVEPLRLSQWMAISGAAFTPGLGRSTSLPLALALGLFNVRLGYWWDSGIPAGSRPGRYPPPLSKALQQLPARIFATQSTILSEWRARFGGPSERLWYLSDGGHFENTGLYELVRRRAHLMIAVDAGQDEDYRFADLALLTRRIRLDFCAELDWLQPAPASGPGDWSHIDAAAAPDVLPAWVKEWLNPEAIARREDISRDAALSVALGRIRYPRDPRAETSWLVLIKGTVGGALPLDCRYFANANPDFPNTPTAQQFFSDEEWESYRVLGQVIGERAFRP